MGLRTLLACTIWLAAGCAQPPQTAAPQHPTQRPTQRELEYEYRDTAPPPDAPAVDAGSPSIPDRTRP
jgi:hypothetical protein